MRQLGRALILLLILIVMVLFLAARLIAKRYGVEIRR